MSYNHAYSTKNKHFIAPIHEIIDQMLKHDFYMTLNTGFMMQFFFIFDCILYTNMANLIVSVHFRQDIDFT